MDSGESLRMAAREIGTHRLRTALTVLGVVIGVGAVVTFVALGASLQADVLGQLGSDDGATLYAWAGPEAESGVRPGAGAEPVFTERDVARLRSLEAVRDAVPYSVFASTELVHDGRAVTRRGAVRTTAPRYLRGQAFAAGRPFAAGADEAVLTPAAAAMWDDPPGVGDQITVVAAGSRRNLTVVGVLNSSAPITGFEGFGEQPRIYTSPDAVGDQRFLLVVVDVAPADIPTAQATGRAYLESESDARGFLPSGYAFRLQTGEEALESTRELLSTLTGFVTAIAVVSLVVGSVGIANVMLVSVTERTRQIGIMRALGAHRRDVLALVLIEAGLLGLVGAVLGTLAGVAGGYLAVWWAGIEPYVFPAEWAVAGVLVGVTVGVLAGLYPAYWAASLDPIRALRAE